MYPVASHVPALGFRSLHPSQASQFHPRYTTYVVSSNLLPNMSLAIFVSRLRLQRYDFFSYLQTFRHFFSKKDKYTTIYGITDNGFLKISPILAETLKRFYIMTNSNNYCVIMGGGIGSRFWPYSRKNLPKQFLDFFGTGRSLIQQTFDRYKKIVPIENIFITTNVLYKELIQEQLPELDKSQILLEPTRRNTAPCIAWASLVLAEYSLYLSLLILFRARVFLPVRRCLCHLHSSIDCHQKPE